MKPINNKITALFMGELDFKTGKWFPIKKMTWTYDDGKYLNCTTVFTKGAKKLQELYPNQPNILTFSTLDQVIRRDDIFSCNWKNRLPVNRKPTPEMLEISGLNFPLDPVEYVARSGGYRHGDPNDIFPEIEADEKGYYNFIFPTTDVYTIGTPNKPELNSIEVGDTVTLQNHESKIKLCCRGHVIGSPPRYIQELSKKYQKNLKTSIFRNNSGFDFAFEDQFLCKASLGQDIGIPFTEEEYQSIHE